jgi:hypothetical protein
LVALSALSPVAAGTAWVVFWQAGLGALCLAPLERLRPGAERLALWLAFQILVAGAVAAALTFAGANSPAAYRTLAAAFLLAGFWRGRGMIPVRLPGFSPAALLGMGAALLAVVLRPVEEIDSLYNLHYVLGWVSNESTPFRFAYNYVPFWELTYLPGIVLARSDAFLWVESLKAVALVGLLLYVLARELGLTERFALPVAGALLVFPHLWNGPSGVATIKNDMIHAAGQVAAAVLCVRAAKGRLVRADTAWLAASAVFLSVKFSGPVLLGAGGLAALAVAHRRLGRHRREVIRAVGCAALVWLPAVGIYYVRNAITYRNPFYPFAIDLIMFRLPGRADLAYSSIAHNLSDPRLWQAFFWPAGGISPAGLLFPAVLAVILLGSAAICLREFGARWRGTSGSPILLALALYQLVCWGVYVRSIYSASGYPGDLAFVRNDLNSLRYVEGALLAGELTLVWLLWGRQRLRTVAALLIGLNSASRVWLIVRREPEISWSIVAALVFVSIGAWTLLPGRWKIAAVAMVVLAGSTRVELRRPAWLVRYQPLYLPLYDLPRQRIYYAVDDEFSQQHCAHLPLAGRRLQHEVIVGPSSQAPPAGTGWVAWLRRAPEDATLPPPVGFTMVAEAPAGALYRAVETTAETDPAY